MSPLLANILLHQLDGELQRRGHRFARYADDLVILVKSQRAGERATDANPRSITRYLDTTLKLKVNPAKSKVAPMSECSFLGFTIKGKKIRWTDKAEPGHEQSCGLFMPGEGPGRWPGAPCKGWRTSSIGSRS